MRRQIALGNRADQGARHGQQRFGFDQGADLTQQRVPNLRLLGVADRLAGIPPGFRQRLQQNAGQLPIVNREPLRAEQRLIRSLPFISDNPRWATPRTYEERQRESGRLGVLGEGGLAVRASRRVLRRLQGGQQGGADRPRRRRHRHDRRRAVPDAEFQMTRGDAVFCSAAAPVAWLTAEMQKRQLICCCFFRCCGWIPRTATGTASIASRSGGGARGSAPMADAGDGGGVVAAGADVEAEMTPAVREYVEGAWCRRHCRARRVDGGALAGLKKKSQADAKRLVALLKKRAEKEKLELVNDYEQQLKQLAGQRSQAVGVLLVAFGCPATL